MCYFTLRQYNIALLSKPNPSEFLYQAQYLCHCWKLLWNWLLCCPLLPVIRFGYLWFNCLWIITINTAFVNCYSLIKEVSVLFGQILQVIAHRKLVLSLVVVQQIGHKSCLVFNPFATLRCRVLRMLQTSLLVCSLPSWIDALFPHFHHSNLTMEDINIQNLHPKFGRFDTYIPFMSLCCTHGVITQIFLEYFWSLRSSFLKVKTKFDAKFQFLEVR